MFSISNLKPVGYSVKLHIEKIKRKRNKNKNNKKNLFILNYKHSITNKKISQMKHIRT